MEENWYEEVLSPDSDVLQQNSKSIFNSRNSLKEDARALSRGIIRVNRPRWQELDSSETLLNSKSVESRFYLVKLGFQFDVPDENREKAYFTYARCSGFIWTMDTTPCPRVYQVIPESLHEGETCSMKVELNPELKIGFIKANIGTVKNELSIGMVGPSTTGWAGDDEKAPYWDLKPKNKKLIGTRNFWMILDFPAKCKGAWLGVCVRGDLKTNRFGIIPVGPEQTEYSKRKKIFIE